MSERPWDLVQLADQFFPCLLRLPLGHVRKGIEFTALFADPEPSEFPKPYRTAPQHLHFSHLRGVHGLPSQAIAATA